MNQINHTEYPKSLRTKTLDSLIYIRQDAQNALDAMPDNPKASYYADEICYVSDELARRAKVNDEARKVIIAALKIAAGKSDHGAVDVYAEALQHIH